MRGRKPQNPRLNELGKPGLTSIPMAEPGGLPFDSVIGDEPDTPDMDDPAAPGADADDPAGDAVEAADSEARRKGGGGHEPPEWIRNEHARGEWRRLLPLMLKRRQYIPLFATELARYCVAFGQYVDAVLIVEKEGPVTKSSKGVKMLSQHWVVMSRAHEIMAKLAADMGLNIVTQVRIQGVQLDLFDEGPARPAEAVREQSAAGGNVTTFGQFRRPK